MLLFNLFVLINKFYQIILKKVKRHLLGVEPFYRFSALTLLWMKTVRGGSSSDSQRTSASMRGSRRCICIGWFNGSNLTKSKGLESMHLQPWISQQLLWLYVRPFCFSSDEIGLTGCAPKRLRICLSAIRCPLGRR